MSHSQLLVLFLLTVQNFSIFGCKEYNQSDFGVDYLVMSMCRVSKDAFPGCQEVYSTAFGIVSKAEIDVFLELSCFLNDPADVGNSISGSSTFSKTTLNIWTFVVHVFMVHTREDSTHGHHQMVNTEISLIIFFAAKVGEALYSQ